MLPVENPQRRVASAQNRTAVQREADDGRLSGNRSTPYRKFIVVEKTGAKQFFQFGSRFFERVTQQNLPVECEGAVLADLLSGGDVFPVGPLRILLLHPPQKPAQCIRTECPIHPQQCGGMNHPDHAAGGKPGVFPAHGVDITRFKITEFRELPFPVPVVVVSHIPLAPHQRAAQRHGLSGGDAESKRFGPAVPDPPREFRHRFGCEPGIGRHVDCVRQRTVGGADRHRRPFGAPRHGAVQIADLRPALPDQLPVTGDVGVAPRRHQVKGGEVGNIPVVQLGFPFQSPAVGQIASAGERLRPVCMPMGVM